MKSMPPASPLLIHIGSDIGVYVSMHALDPVWKGVRAYEEASERG